MPLIDNLQEALDNIERFQDIGDDESIALTRLSMFKDWYYNPKINKFGPGKFIGYKNTSIISYTGAGNGGATHRQLNNFFRIVDTEDENYTDLKRELDDFVKYFGKTLSARFNTTGGIYIPKEQKSINSSLNGESHPDDISDEDVDSLDVVNESSEDADDFDKPVIIS